MLLGLRPGTFAHEHGEHEPRTPVLELIVASKLPLGAEDAPLFEIVAADDALGDGDGQNIRLPRKARHAHEQFVKPFPVHLVRKDGFRHDASSQVDLVVFFHDVIHILRVPP